MICRRCSRDCDGTMMRTDLRYTRTREMLEAEAPQDMHGRYEFCHGCQRAAYFAKGVVKLLANDLTATARYAAHHRGVNGCPRCGSDRVKALGGKAGLHGLSKCYECRKQFSTRATTAQRATKLPEQTWATAEGLFAAGRSTLAVAATLGVTQRTAWLMSKRLGSATADSRTASGVAAAPPPDAELGPGSTKT